MAAGHIVNNQCVDVAFSTDAFYTNTPAQTNPNDNTFTSVFNKTASGWVQDIYRNGNLFNTYTLPTPIFPTCDTTEGFFDGMQLGWAVASVMIAVYVIRRPFR